MRLLLFFLLLSLSAQAASDSTRYHFFYVSADYDGAIYSSYPHGKHAVAFNKFNALPAAHAGLNMIFPLEKNLRVQSGIDAALVCYKSTRFYSTLFATAPDYYHRRYYAVFVNVPLLLGKTWTKGTSDLYVLAGPELNFFLYGGGSTISETDGNIFQERMHYDRDMYSAGSLMVQAGKEWRTKKGKLVRIGLSASCTLISSADFFNRRAQFPWTAGLQLGLPCNPQRQEARRAERNKIDQGKRNTIDVAIFGAGRLAAVNYERSVFRNANQSLELHVRAGGLYTRRGPGALAGVEITYGKGLVKLEAGAGGGWNKGKYWSWAGAGARYVGTKGLVMRAGVEITYPLMARQWITAGVGYNW